MALLHQTVEWRRIQAMSLALCLLVVVTLSSQHSAQELQWVRQMKCEAAATMWEPREAMSSLGLWGRPGISHYGLDSLHPKMLKSWSPGLWMRPIWKQGLCRLSSQERTLGWTPNAYDCLQKRKIWTQVDMSTLREKTCKDEGGGWSDAATSQGAPRVARKPPEARRETGSSSWPWKEPALSTRPWSIITDSDGKERRKYRIQEQGRSLDQSWWLERRAGTRFLLRYD